MTGKLNFGLTDIPESDEARAAAGARVVAAAAADGEGGGVHLHDERLVPLLPLAGVFVVLEATIEFRILISRERNENSKWEPILWFCMNR